MTEQEPTVTPLALSLSSHPILDSAWREVATAGHGLYEWMLIGAALCRAPEHLNLSALSCQSFEQCQRTSDQIEAFALAVEQDKLADLFRGADADTAQIARILQVAICGNTALPLLRWEVFAGLLGPVEMGERLRRLANALRACALIG